MQSKTRLERDPWVCQQGGHSATSARTAEIRGWAQKCDSRRLRQNRKKALNTASQVTLPRNFALMGKSGMGWQLEGSAGSREGSLAV